MTIKSEYLRVILGYFRVSNEIELESIQNTKCSPKPAKTGFGYYYHGKE